MKQHVNILFIFILPLFLNPLMSVSQTGSLKDIDGNVYKTVKIGTQIWMAENLRTTKYIDGASIPKVVDTSAWKNLTKPAYCWYNNDAPKYKKRCGALYNAYVLNTHKLCPTGWHIPSDAEWTKLINYLGTPDDAGGKMKSTDLAWENPNTGATNESGFSALPSGIRGLNGTFHSIDSTAYFWSSSEGGSFAAYIRHVDYNSSACKKGISFYKQVGFSIRCVKD